LYQRVRTHYCAGIFVGTGIFVRAGIPVSGSESSG
jgi:hypothetical protein